MSTHFNEISFHNKAETEWNIFQYWLSIQVRYISDIPPKSENIKVIAINNLEGRSNGYYRPLDKFMHHLTELQKRATMEIPKENKHTCDSTN